MYTKVTHLPSGMQWEGNHGDLEDVQENIALCQRRGTLCGGLQITLSDSEDVFLSESILKDCVLTLVKENL